MLPYARKGYKPVKVKEKSLEDLKAILDGQADPKDRSAAKVREVWGSRLPLLYDTLVRLDRKEIGVGDAAEILGLTKSSVHNLRARYGIAPGTLKGAKKTEGRYKMGAKEARKLSLDVVAGRKTAKDAAKGANISLRTLHRHLEHLLRPQFLNEISHWSKSFRLALAYEIEKGIERHTIKWLKWAKKRHLLLKKTSKWPK